jgi:CIC family chloride channel protein
MVSPVIAIGVLAGVAAIVLRLLLPVLQSLFFVDVTPSMSLLSPFLPVLLPAFGGLLSGILVNSLAQEARGAGISHLLQAVLMNGSRVRPRVAVVKLAATSLVVGSGGSAGIMGPMVQVGGTVGSAVGQMLHLSEDRLRILLASGAAGGMAAVVNAPISGLFFAQEVILERHGGGAFGLVALTAATASLIARPILGVAPLFPAPQYRMTHPLELLLYLTLGGIAAAIGVAFTHTLACFDALFSRLPVPCHSKPIVGGIGVGIVGLFFPEVRGLGFETVGASLEEDLPLTIMAALVVAKLIATCLTVGSGASGGVVGPSLYLGAVLGGTAGTLFHALLPDITATSGAYALVGMAAVFSATFHAPITAVSLGLELTGNYQMILPLIVGCAAGRYLARRISPHTIYGFEKSREPTVCPTVRSPLG